MTGFVSPGIGSLSPGVGPLRLKKAQDKAEPSACDHRSKPEIGPIRIMPDLGFVNPKVGSFRAKKQILVYLSP